MPAIYSFAINAGFAILIDFLMQLTVFVSLMTLDMARQEAGRYDLVCCVKMSKETKEEEEEREDRKPIVAR